MTRISVVTACYNAAGYIEDTLRSVLDQEYCDLEYIVIDGGSDDGTQEIIERYRDRLAYFVSERDGGQYEAIQKGIALATGEVMCWLNADDISMPWTLSVVSEVFETHKDVDWITGQPAFINRHGQLTSVYGSMSCYPQNFIANGWFNRDLGGFLQQENMFWRRSLWEKVGGLDLNLRLAADYALWTSMAQHAELVPVAVPLAAFRQLPGEQRSSIGADKYDAEVVAVMDRLPRPPVLWRWFSSYGLVARSVMRLLIWRRAPAILYDNASQSWRMIVNRRPVARVHTADLLNQNALRNGAGQTAQ